MAVAPSAFSRARGCPVGQAGAELRQAAVEVGEAVHAADFHENCVEVVGLVVEERDGAVGVDAVERERRLVLLLAQLRVLVIDRVVHVLRRIDSACAPDSWFSRRECSSSRAVRTSLAARSRLSSSCLLVRCVSALTMRVCPLGCLHPLVCAPPPLRRGERAEMIVTVGVCRVVPDLASRSLEAAKGFYGDVLGLQPAMDHDWIITRPILDGRMSSSA